MELIETATQGGNDILYLDSVKELGRNGSRTSRVKNKGALPVGNAPSGNAVYSGEKAERNRDANERPELF